MEGIILNLILSEFPFTLEELISYQLFFKFKGNIPEIKQNLSLNRKKEREIIKCIGSLICKFQREFPNYGIKDLLNKFTAPRFLFKYSDLIFTLCQGWFLALNDLKKGRLTIKEIVNSSILDEKYVTPYINNRKIRKPFLSIRFVQLISLTSLAYFGNYEEAAYNLSKSIPEIKFEISSLEKILRTKLIYSKNKNISLTPAGFLTLKFSIKILKASYRIYYEFDILKNGPALETYSKPWRIILPTAYEIFAFTVLMILFRILPQIPLFIVILTLKITIDLEIFPRFSILKENNIELILNSTFGKKIIGYIHIIIRILSIINFRLIPIYKVIAYILGYITYPIALLIEFIDNYIDARIKKFMEKDQLKLERRAVLQDLTWGGQLNQIYNPNPFYVNLVKKGRTYLPISFYNYKKEIKNIFKLRARKIQLKKLKKRKDSIFYKITSAPLTRLILRVKKIARNLKNKYRNFKLKNNKKK